MKKYISTICLVIISLVSFNIAHAQFVAPLYIVTSSLANATAGQPYSYQLQVSGGVAPYTWNTISTTYPSACCILGLNGSGMFTTQTSSVISSNFIGTYSWTVQVTDNVGATASKTVSLTIDSACKINTFYANPYTITTGQSTNLTWTTQGCNTVQLFATNSQNNTFSSPLSTSSNGNYNVNVFPTAGTYYYKLVASTGFSVDPVNGPISTVATVNVTAPTGIISLNKNIIINGTVYYIDNLGRSRSPYTSAGAFLSYGFNSWSTIVLPSSADLALPVTTYSPTGTTQVVTYFIPPRNGSLINDNGTVYLITNGTRAGFTDPQTFLRLGYSFANVLLGDTSFMTTVTEVDSMTTSHPAGTVVNLGGTLYFIRNGARLGIPSMAIFNSWGLKLKEVVGGNSYDAALTEGAAIQFRLDNSFGI